MKFNKDYVFSFMGGMFSGLLLLSLLRSLDNSATSPKSLNTPNNNKPLIAPPMAENKKEEAFFKKDKVVWKHIERIFSPVTWFMGWCVLTHTFFFVVIPDVIGLMMG